MRFAYSIMFFAMATCLLVSSAGCPSRDPGGRGSGDVCEPAGPACDEGLVCEAATDGVSRCSTPVRIKGTVLALADDSPIEGALVQALDVNGAPVGTSASTDASGAYVLTVPAPRDMDGVPSDGIYTLRVQAQGYQEFPTAIRPALPLDAASATSGDGEWVIDNPLTIVKLIALPGDVSLLGSIAGAIQAANPGGILVVAEGGATALTGFSDVNGQYVVFNVPAGSYTLRGYAAGVQISPTTTSLEAGERKTGVNLTGSSQPLSTVSGNIQIVNAPGGSQTSVVLAVESTFVESLGRGSVPPGLRVGGVAGTFTINNVPDGRYVVLAAFENDGLVRDPDQTIGGTEIVRIQVPDPSTGNVVSLPEGFKVTAALAVVSPGADGPEQVTSATPTLQWADDSSEEGYEIVVLDAFGNEMLRDQIGPVSGSSTVSYTYAGPALEAGMFYQFRATSLRDKNGVLTAISSTEDLVGVFYYLEQ
jgi:hypothetical protein